MGAIQAIFHQYAPDYLKRFHQTVSAEQRQAIEAIGQCRTEALGTVGYQCEDCGCPHLVPAACGNRHCPQCQHRKACLWLERQLERQLPGPHFRLTFTVPVCAFLLRHPRLGYGALFEASSQALKTLARDSRFVGGDEAGFFGVLPTWGRQLHYHPPIHDVVPGGALASDDGTWRAASPGFFLPVRARSQLFRAKFRDRLQRLGRLAEGPAEAWAQAWNVHGAAMPHAEASIAYLAPYVFKVALSDPRIVRVEDGRVSFTYKKPGSARPRTLTLDALEFIRRFLQHVLPSGVMKVRYYGFLSPTARVSLAEVRAKVELAHGFDVSAPDVPPPHAAPVCPVCGGRLRDYRSWRRPPVASSPTAPDSGAMRIHTA